jgi:hypothetical protein
MVSREGPWWNITHCPKCSPLPIREEKVNVEIPPLYLWDNGKLTFVTTTAAIIAELEDLEQWAVNPDEIIDWVTVTVEIRRRIAALKEHLREEEGLGV